MTPTPPASSAAPAALDPAWADVTALGDQLLRLTRKRLLDYRGARLEVSAFRLLWVLADGTPRTLRQLSETLGLEQSTINRQVNAAIAAGHLERLERGEGASRPVRPTEQGARLYAHDAELRAGALRAALARLGQADADRLVALLTAFNDAWDAALDEAGAEHP